MVNSSVISSKDPPIIRYRVPLQLSTCALAGWDVMWCGMVWYSSQAIASECGIYDPEYGIAMEGPEFRKLTPKQLDDVLPRLQVLGSAPQGRPLQKQDRIGCDTRAVCCVVIVVITLFSIKIDCCVPQGRIVCMKSAIEIRVDLVRCVV